MSELWYPDAIRDPAPTSKTWQLVNTFQGVILHSMEGYWPAARAMLMGSAEVSWHYSILQDGSVHAHYRLDESPWHAGSKAQNLRLIGVEHEGVKGEPLTPLQLKASVALVRWIAREARWEGLQRGTTLMEHHEVNPATQCPSGRIPWAAYTEEEAVEVIKFVNADEIEAVRDTIAATVDDGVQFVGQIVKGYDVPPGYKAIIAVVKE